MTTTGRTRALPPVDPTLYPKADENERKRRTRRLVALLLFLLAALAVIAYFLLRSVGVLDAKVTVPNVVGDTRTVAIQTLENDQLTAGTITSQNNPAPFDTVLSTNPSQGRSVAKNSAVNLVLSRGPNIPIVTVPDVTNEQLVTAEAKLTAAGLTFTPRVVSSSQPQNTVLSQSPPGGSRVRANMLITLTVSGAQTSVSVPTVTGQSPTQAGATLAHAGLTVGGQTSACSDQFPAGAVSAQSPAGNTTVAPNTPVNITVASGPCAPPPTTPPTTAPPTTTTTTAPPTTTTTTTAPTTTTTVAPTGAAPHTSIPITVPHSRGNGQG